MPVFVFTYHAYRSWLPDHPRGYIERGKGRQFPSEREAERYRQNAQHDEFTFTSELQALLIAESRNACNHQGLRLHLAATEPTHVHVLVSWMGDKAAQQVSKSLKSSLTRALRKHSDIHDVESARPFFSHGSDRTRLHTRDHFNHWMNKYGPSHIGLVWREGDGVLKK